MTDNNESSRFWKRPGAKWLLGIPLGGFVAFGLGAIALGTMNYTLHATSTTEFCYTCHSHESFIKPEYESSGHFVNTAGVRAGCADCHLPHDNWFEYVWTKAVVSLDIVPELMGKLDTAERNPCGVSSRQTIQNSAAAATASRRWTWSHRVAQQRGATRAQQTRIRPALIATTELSTRCRKMPKTFSIVSMQNIRTTNSLPRSASLSRFLRARAGHRAD